MLWPDPGEVELLQPYRDVLRAPHDGRPWVMANMVAGVDGTAARDGSVGALTNGPDSKLYRALRALPDVVFVGAETVRVEKYRPIRLATELSEERAAAGRSAQPRIAIVSGSLKFDWDAPLFNSDEAADKPILFTSKATTAEALDQAALHAEIIVAGAERVDLGEAIVELGRLGHQIVLCEGGPSLLGEVMASGLLDELCLTISPLAGGDPLPVAVTPSGGSATNFELMHTAIEDGTLFLRYEVRRSN